MKGKLVKGKLVWYEKVGNGLLLGDNIIINPTDKQFKEAGYYDVEIIEDEGKDKVVKGVIKHYVGKPDVNLLYKNRVGELISEKYTINDEIALHRQKDSKPDQYQEYYEYCEACKAQAKKELGIDELV